MPGITAPDGVPPGAGIRGSMTPPRITSEGRRPHGACPDDVATPAGTRGYPPAADAFTAGHNGGPVTTGPVAAG